MEVDGKIFDHVSYFHVMHEVCLLLLIFGGERNCVRLDTVQLSIGARCRSPIIIIGLEVVQIREQVVNKVKLFLIFALLISICCCCEG